MRKHRRGPKRTWFARSPRGRLDRELLCADALKAIADLCVNCHQCRLECPAGVDIPKLMIETKAQYVAANGVPPSDLAAVAARSGGPVGQRDVSCGQLGDSQSPGALAAGEDGRLVAARKLPRFAGAAVCSLGSAQEADTTDATAADRKVLYFVDLYANYFDPQLGGALVARFRAQRRRRVCASRISGRSGMSMISMGAFEPARKLAEHNIPLLAEAVRQGYHDCDIRSIDGRCASRTSI